MAQRKIGWQVILTIWKSYETCRQTLRIDKRIAPWRARWEALSVSSRSPTRIWSVATVWGKPSRSTPRIEKFVAQNCWLAWSAASTLSPPSKKSFTISTLSRTSLPDVRRAMSDFSATGTRRGSSTNGTRWTEDSCSSSPDSKAEIWGKPFRYNPIRSCFT